MFCCLAGDISLKNKLPGLCFCRWKIKLVVLFLNFELSKIK